MSRADPDVMSFFMGGGSPTAKFETVGTMIKGLVLSEELVQCTDPETQKPEVWDNGQPKMQVILTLQTELSDPEIEEDDGKRRVFAKSYMKTAIREAVKASKYKGRSLVGGELAIKYSANGKKSKPAFSPPKLYEAKFVPPSIMDEVAKDPESDW